jgi:hypothetical protein
LTAIGLEEILVIMDQYIIKEMRETILYLIVFVTSICIILHYYVFPSVKRAIFLDNSTPESDKRKKPKL